jgi:Family of unknown function (DUF6600)/FecR protein
MKTRNLIAFLIFAVAMMTAGASAQDYSEGPSGPNGESAPASEGPQPDVARISLIHGDVSMQRGDTGDWAATSINAPLVRGDQVATGDKSRAEIQLDYANIVRLAAGSQVKIADLARTRIQLQVAQGYASFTQLKGSEADVEIDSPNVAVRPLKHGRYRVQVNSDSETDVIVRDGEAEITTPQGSTRVKSGQMIQVRGTDNPEYRIAEAPKTDDWDRWNKDRDGVIRDAQSWGRTNRYYTGVHDLDAYGRWVFVPGYGWVWQPSYTSAGWAPYQSGRWVWEPYYGWTWVSYEPWGWAPYHYGRWFYHGGNWCWWPGPVYVSYRPVWSPAFVFFVGFGHHSSFGFGSIGWFPVGPHDPFYPWYGRGFNRVNVVNITNITVINGRHGGFIAPLAVRGRHPYYSNVNLVQTNVHLRGAVTSVGVEDFGRGNFSHRHSGIEDHEWHEARVMTANLPVVPGRENLRVSANGNTGVPATVRPRDNGRFYTRRQPPAPEAFHTQVERVQRVVGPQAVGAEGNVRTDMHGGPGQVERHDIGGANTGVRGNTEVPRIGGNPGGPGTSSAGGNQQPRGDGRFGRPENANTAAPGNEGGKESPKDSPGGFRRFGNGSGSNNAGIGPGQNAGPKEGSARTGPGANEGVAQSNPPANSGNAQPPNSGGNAQNDRGNDRGGNERGWNKFGQRGDRSGAETGAGRSEQSGPPAVKSNDQGRVPRTDATPAPHTEDRGSWQHFPANEGGRGNDSGNRAERNNGGGNKPPLELHRPIVTPRPDSSRDTQDSRSDQRYSPPPARTPEVHNEPRYSPPPARTPEVHNEPRYSPPPARTPEVRNEPRYSPPPARSEPRYSPPSQSRGDSGRGSSGRSESHGGGGSSSSHGSGERGNHSDSKSSGPKQR